MHRDRGIVAGVARSMCLALVVAVVGCGRLDYARHEPDERDAAVFDASFDASADASFDDASFDDAAADAEVVDDDAGPSDAGPSDAGSIDAGSDGGPGPCGRIGNACCPGAPTCTEGACLGGVCASSGGAYVEQIGAGSTVTCAQPNPLTGACACPPGFTRGGVFEVYRNEAIPQIVELFFCDPPIRPSVGLVAACERCTCPAGTDTGDHSCPFTGFYMDSFVTCTGTGAPGDRFAGVYSQLGATCDQPNAYTGACTCPPGSATTSLALGCRSAVLCWRP